jgi:hypothetical protein
MNDDLRHRRRAVYTALHPYLDGESLQQALEHWQQCYSDAPRFRLQRFVHEVCQLANLRERRSDIHLSLVQAMNMSADALLEDPAAPVAQRETDQADAGEQRVFTLLVDTLIAGVPADERQQLCLNLLSSLRRDRFPASLRDDLRLWLIDNGAARMSGASVPALRAVINRSWVLLTERLGPATADRLLQQACDRTRARAPELADELARLL